MTEERGPASVTHNREHQEIVEAVRELVLDELGGVSDHLTEHTDATTTRYSRAGADRIVLRSGPGGVPILELTAGTEPGPAAGSGTDSADAVEYDRVDPAGLFERRSGTLASLSIPSLEFFAAVHNDVADVVRAWLAALGPELGPVERELVARLRAAGCVYAEDEVGVILATSDDPAERERMIASRERGTPLEYVVGWALFCGIRVAISDGVFVPRRRTEFLAERAIDILRGHGERTENRIVVDLCCGSGAIGLAIASSTTAVAQLGSDAADTSPPAVELYAADIDPVAVACAAQNIAGIGGVAAVGNLYGALPVGLRGRITVLVANCPYVPSSEIAFLPAEARLHEPITTLDGGSDGLDIQRRVAAAAPQWLAPGGSLLIETGEHQAATTAALFEAAGLRTRTESSDRLGATVVIGVRPSSPKAQLRS